MRRFQREGVANLITQDIRVLEDLAPQVEDTTGGVFEGPVRMTYWINAPLQRNRKELGEAL